MVIAINTRFLLHDKLEGIGWFTYETLQRITQQHPEHTFHFLFDRPYHPSFLFGSNVIPHVLNPPARHPLLWYLWFEYAVPRALRRIKPDVFVSTDGYASLNTNVPTLTVVHDLAFKHHPAQVNNLVQRYYTYFTPRYLQHVKRIATVSHYTKQDVVNTYHINPDKIDVLCNGANAAFVPADDAIKKTIKQQYAAGQDYFIYVGAIHPRKNVPMLIKAFDRFKTQTKSPYKLLIVGRKAWDTKEVDTAYAESVYAKDIIFIDYAERHILAQLVASATAMVYISVFEGFGIPIVEAMQAGTAVITSNISSMPEVAGGAALLVNPLDIQDVAQAMTDIATNESLRQSLIQKGLVQKDTYTWDKAAEALWASILKTVSL